MSFQTPSSICSLFIAGLGKLDGFEYANGVQQYCGIPYAKLSKRWTRSVLNTSWANDFHDGTRLGYGYFPHAALHRCMSNFMGFRNDCPRPNLDEDGSDDLVPVTPAPHFPDQPKIDELTGLVMNIVLPSAPIAGGHKYPIITYVHGGSLLYGGANHPIFDAVNFVSHSISIKRPIICINFNYRVGLGGFLAGSVIQAELELDGFQGSGNFGFTDQQVAFEWIQRYISHFGGDPESVTAVGESAGGISISNQMVAANAPKFQHAVCMSGLSVSIPAWTMDEHEALFKAVCHYFRIRPEEPGVLDRLREIPQQTLANATPVIQGVLSGTGNPCLDGWFYTRDPREIHTPPDWLKGYMLGDTYHEGIIFHLNLLGDNFDSIRSILLQYISDESKTNEILHAYGICPEISHDLLLDRVEHMCGDAIFKIPNYATALTCSELKCHIPLYLYHFDQRSRIKNVFEGTAYHAHELLYLFGNLDNKLNEHERTMALDFATAWIRFAYGEQPWLASKGQWKVWGPNSTHAVKTEAEDENIRSYMRMKHMLAIGNGKTWKEWFKGVDALVNKRMNLGKVLPQ